MTTAILMISAALLLLVLVAVVLRPWWRKAPDTTGLQALNVSVFESRMAELVQDQAQGRLEEDEFAAQQVALQRQLLAASQMTDPDRGASGRVSRISIAMVALWIPLLILMVYVLVSNRGATFAYLQAQDRYQAMAAQIVQGQEPKSASDVADGVGLLQTLQTQLYRRPDDPERWLHLSQAYTAAEAPEPALQALERAHRLAPDNDRITMTYAQMRFFTQQGRLDDTTRRIVLSLLSRQPDHEGAMMLMAMGSFRGADYTQAIEWLQRLRALRLSHAQGDTQASAIDALDQAIAQAQDAQQHSLTLQVSVQLSAALRAQVAPSDTVFVYVRALQGMPMPYAVHKRSAADLLSAGTLTETLSDQDAMVPGRTLSAGKASGETLVVGARISKSGNPVAQPGDLEALPMPLGNQSQFQLTIDQQR